MASGKGQQKSRFRIAVGLAAVVLVGLVGLWLGVGFGGRTHARALGIGDLRSAAASPWPTTMWFVPHDLVDGRYITSDGTLYARVTSPDGTSQVTTVGTGDDASIVGTDGPPVLLVRSFDGSCRIVRYDAASATWPTVMSTPLGQDVATAFASSSDVYFQPPEADASGQITQGADVQVTPLSSTAADRSGGLSSPLSASPAGRVALAPLKPDPSASPPSGQKRIFPTGAGAGEVEGLVRTGDRLLAFRSTFFAAGVTDLSTGSTVQYADFGCFFVDTAVLGGDGLLHVLAWAPTRPDVPKKVLTIDPGTLELVSVADTGVVGRVLSVAACPTDSGAAIMVAASSDSNTGPMTLRLWAIDGKMLSSVATLTPGTGVRLSRGPGHSVLLYGGLARNAVQVVDLADGKVTRDLASQDAPSGSEVLGITSK